MQRKLVKKNVYNAGKSSTNQELVFQHMSNHYRRILNAKKTIDTSPPYCYQKKKVLRAATTTSSIRNIRAASRNISPALTERSISTNSCKGSCWGTESYTGSSRYHASCVPDNPNANAGNKCNCVDMDLIDRITYDTKNGPAAYCDEGWLEIKAQHNDKSYKTSFKTNENRNDDSNSKRRIQIKGTESKQKRKYATQIKNKNSPEIPTKRSLEAPNCKCTSICICHTNEGDLDFKKSPDNPKESQTSSRDSAYNGGVSSLPESRSPTPDQRGKKECCCMGNARYFCGTKDSKPHKKTLKAVKDVEDLSSSGLESPRETCPTKTPTEDLKESLEKMKNDELYIKFIQDITVEVLEKCLYTNKALIKVMKKHIMENLHTLDKERMIKEVNNLRIQLGIPEDKNLLDLNVDSVESSTSILNPYPVISDSAFVMPKALQEETKQDLSNSVSEIMAKKNPNGELIFQSESSDSETISVIQVGKGSREKRKGKSTAATPVDLTPSQGNSADESDQSSECPNRRTKEIQNFSFSSSENEDSEKKQTGGDKNDKTNEGKEVFSCTGKKSRSVSFWNNDHASRGVEIKETRTLCCSKRKNAQERKN